MTFTATGASSVKLTTEGSPEDISLEYSIVQLTKYKAPIDVIMPPLFSLEYSIDNGEYTTYIIGDTISLSDGQSVSMRAVRTNDGINFSYVTNYYKFVMSGSIVASGNIQSLLDKTCQRMDVPECCYQYLFSGCSALTQAPELPATTLADNCYYNMFNGCTSLTQAPELPATTLAGQCYANMFYGCSNLSSINVNFSDWMNSGLATVTWVDGVASSGTFTCPTTLAETYGTDNIPTNWTVVRK